MRDGVVLRQRWRTAEHDALRVHAASHLDLRESVRRGSASRAPAAWRIRGSPCASWMPCFRLRRRDADTGAPGLVELGDRRNRPAEPHSPAEPVDSAAAANRRVHAGAATTGRPAGRQTTRRRSATRGGDHGVRAVRGAVRGAGPASPGIAAVRHHPPPMGEITCWPAALCPTARRTCGANTTWWSWRCSCSAWDGRLTWLAPRAGTADRGTLP